MKPRCEEGVSCSSGDSISGEVSTTSSLLSVVPNPFDHLDDAIILRIFKLIPIIHLLKCVAFVNKRFGKLCKDSDFKKIVHLRPEIECMTPLYKVQGE